MDGPRESLGSPEEPVLAHLPGGSDWPLQSHTSLREDRSSATCAGQGEGVPGLACPRRGAPAHRETVLSRLRSAASRRRRGRQAPPEYLGTNTAAPAVTPGE